VTAIVAALAFPFVSPGIVNVAKPKPGSPRPHGAQYVDYLTGASR
jgi:hypothetical protein